MNKRLHTPLMKTIIAVSLLCLGGLLLAIRISAVNIDASRQLSPASMPGTWELNAKNIARFPWPIPDSCGMLPGYYRGIEIVDIGNVTIEDYDTFVAHADLPPDYLEFDKQGTVSYALLPLTLRNTSPEDILIQFSDFWLFCGIVPGSCAQALLPQFNQDASSTIEPGAESQFIVVYRILRNGFPSDESWEHMSDRGFQLVIPAYPDKYIFDLTIE